MTNQMINEDWYRFDGVDSVGMGVSIIHNMQPTGLDTIEKHFKSWLDDVRIAGSTLSFIEYCLEKERHFTFLSVEGFRNMNEKE